MYLFKYFVFLFTVHHDLLDKQETEEYIKNMAGNIAVPVLILWGEHDKVCHIEHHHKLNEPHRTVCFDCTVVR